MSGRGEEGGRGGRRGEEGEQGEEGEERRRVRRAGRKGEEGFVNQMHFTFVHVARVQCVESAGPLAPLLPCFCRPSLGASTGQSVFMEGGEQRECGDCRRAAAGLGPQKVPT